MSRAGGPNQVGALSVAITGDTSDVDKKLNAVGESAKGAGDNVQSLAQSVADGRTQWALYGASVISTATSFYTIGDAIGNAVFQLKRFDAEMKIYEDVQQRQISAGGAAYERRVAEATKGTIAEGAFTQAAAERTDLQLKQAQIQTEHQKNLELFGKIDATTYNPITVLRGAYAGIMSLSSGQELAATNDRLNTVNGQLRGADRFLGNTARARAGFADGVPNTFLTEEERRISGFGGPSAERAILDMKRYLYQIDQTGRRELNTMQQHGLRGNGP